MRADLPTQPTIPLPGSAARIANLLSILHLRAAAPRHPRCADRTHHAGKPTATSHLSPAYDPPSPMRWPSPILLLALALPALADQSLRQAQDIRRRNTEQGFSTCAQLPGAYRLPDLVRFRIVNNTIVLASNPPAAADNGTYRVNIEDLGGLNTLSIGRTGQGKVPESLTFTHFDFSDAHAVLVTTTVTWNFNSLSISRYSQFPNGFRQVSFAQGEQALDDNAPQPANPSSAVALLVQAATGNDQLPSVELSAPDMLALRRDHGAQVDQHLRPILHDLQMESMFAADPLIAWQVFCNDLTPDPRLTTQIASLLPDLDSDSSTRRERAIKTLESRGIPMAIALAHFDQTRLTPQQSVLIDTALAPYRPQHLQDLPALRRDRTFLIDCLYLDDPQLRHAALRQLSKITDSRLDSREFEDPARRDLAIESLRARLTGAKQAKSP